MLKENQVFLVYRVLLVHRDHLDLQDLPDLTGLPLEELLDAPNPVLARAARRVLDRLMAEEAPLAAYHSSAVPLDDPPV